MNISILLPPNLVTAFPKLKLKLINAIYAHFRFTFHLLDQLAACSSLLEALLEALL